MFRAVGQAWMSHKQSHISGWFLAAGWVCLFVPGLQAGDTLKETVKLSGTIAGTVTNTLGSPQMGAAVVLYNRQDRVCDKAITNERGQFSFAGLFPDLYAIRVSLPTFMPAIRKDILVQSGVRALLNVNLNTLFSSIQVAYPPAGGALMTDDWKWVLRSASSTRPVLRFTDDPPVVVSSRQKDPSVLSETRGLLQLSAGDGPLVTGTGDQADLGTAFALATSFIGNSHLELSGNLGYGAQTGAPVTAFRTAYAPSNGPEVSVTMRQVYLVGRSGSLGPSDFGVPVFRSVSTSADERAQLSDQLSLQYGLSLDSVAFSAAHLSYFSPYARLVYAVDDNSHIALAYSSGNARPDLEGADSEVTAPEDGLQHDLDSIGLFPRISELNNQLKIQHGNEFEVSYSHKIGSREFEASAYREIVTNAALSLVGPAGAYAAGDFLPDLFTGNATFNAGNYNTSGYTAGLTQNIGQHVKATVMYGTMPGFTVGSQEVVSTSPDDLRSMIRASHRQGVTARLAATAPWTGTRLVTSYQWLADSGWLTLGNIYTTQSLAQIPGLNLYIRQPVPMFASLPWRLEVTADLRNLLAQSYLPLDASSGQPLLLVETPRTFRGGLSFIF